MRIFLFCQALLFVFLCKAQLSEVKYPTHEEEVWQLSTAIMQTLDHFKGEDDVRCFIKMQSLLRMKATKNSTYQLEGCTIDSLVVNNESGWARFNVVDLDYLTELKASMIIKAENAKELAERMAQEMTKRGYQLQKSTDNELYIFKDSRGGFVTDTRFEADKVNYIGKKYDWKIEVLDEYLVMEMMEIVSDSWVAAN